MSIESFDTYNNLSNELIAFGRSNTNDILCGAFLKAKEQLPNLDAVIVKGWTPGFNDGDPCTFSMVVSAAELVDHLDDETTEKLFGEFHGKTVADFDDENEYTDYVFDNINEGISYRNEQPVMQSTFYAIGELLRRTYGEDGFQLIIKQEDNGNIVVDYSYYECGY